MSVRKIDRLEPDQLIVCHCSANNSRHPEIVEFIMFNYQEELIFPIYKNWIKKSGCQNKLLTL